MKPFNLEKALAGEKVMTRAGVELLHIFHAPKATSLHNKIVAVMEKNGVLTYYEDGKYSASGDTVFDLVMAPKLKKIEGWVNYYDSEQFGSVYCTKVLADNAVRMTDSTLIHQHYISFEVEDND